MSEAFLARIGAPNEIKERVEPFVRKLRAAHPHTPIVLVEDRSFTNSPFLPSRREHHAASRAALRAAYDRLVAAGVGGAGDRGDAGDHRRPEIPQEQEDDHDHQRQTSQKVDKTIACDAGTGLGLHRLNPVIRDTTPEIPEKSEKT